MAAGEAPGFVNELGRPRLTVTAPFSNKSTLSRRDSFPPGASATCTNRAQVLNTSRSLRRLPWNRRLNRARAPGLVSSMVSSTCCALRALQLLSSSSSCCSALRCRVLACKTEASTDWDRVSKSS